MNKLYNLLLGFLIKIIISNTKIIYREIKEIFKDDVSDINKTHVN